MKQDTRKVMYRMSTAVVIFSLLMRLIFNGNEVFAEQNSLEKIFLSTQSLNLDFNYVKKYLPKEEAKYQDRTGEYPGIIEYLYDKGDFRVFVSPYTNKVSLVKFNSSKSSYKYVSKYKSNNSYKVSNIKGFYNIAYASPVDKATFITFTSFQTTPEIIDELLGKPTYKIHVHGVGISFSVYAERGLMFLNGECLVPSSVSDIQYDDELFCLGYSGKEEYNATQLKNYRQSIYKKLKYEDYLKHFNSKVVLQGYEILPDDSLFNKGVKSPNGLNVAVIQDNGGYWDNYIWIKRKNQVPLQFNPDYFVCNLKWLNDNILYVDSADGESYYLIDINKNTLKKLKKPAAG